MKKLSLKIDKLKNLSPEVSADVKGGIITGTGNGNCQSGDGGACNVD